MKRMRWAIATAALAALVYLLWPDQRPNVLLITIDSLRPDRLSSYGDPQAYTPNLNRLAAEGVLFRNAFTDVPWTTAAVASTMTGRYTLHHGLVSPYQRLRDEEITLAEVLAGEGYETAAVIGSFPLDHIFNLSQGFRTYDDRYNDVMKELPVKRARMPSVFHEDINENRIFQSRKLESDSFRTDPSVADAAIGWLRRAPRRRPFFLWVDFFGPHHKERWGEPAVDALQRYLREYGGDVTRVDREVGRLIDEITASGLRTQTLIIVHSDHGRSLLEHNFYGDAKRLYDPSLRVPLILSFPGRFRGGTEVKALVRNVDIMPSILEIAGVDSPPGLDGHSLVMLAAGETADEHRETYCATLASASAYHSEKVSAPDGSFLWLGFQRRGLRNAQWKYILNEPHAFIDFTEPPPLPEGASSRYRSEELYNLVRDPKETRNVLARQPRVAEEMRRRLEAMESTATGREAGGNGGKNESEGRRRDGGDGRGAS